MLNMNAREIARFAQLAGIQLTELGVEFPKLCARATVVYATTGMIDTILDKKTFHYVPMYMQEYEDKTGFNQNQLTALEFGFEGHESLAMKYGQHDTKEYRVGVELRRMVNNREEK